MKSSLSCLPLSATLVAATLGGGCISSTGSDTSISSTSCEQLSDYCDDSDGGGSEASCESSTGTTCDGTDAYIESDADVAAISTCTTLQSLYVANTSTVTAITLPNLLSIGSIYLDGAAIQSFSAPCLSEASGVASFHTSNLETIDLPSLSSVSGDFSIGNVAALATLHIGELTSTGGMFYVADAPALCSLRAGQLATVGGYLYVNNNPVLTCVALDALSAIGGYAYLARNPEACVPTVATLTPITAGYVYEAGNKVCP